VTPASFEVKASAESGVEVVAVKGELDLATAPELREVLEPVADRAEALLVDLSSCEFIDSTGLAALVAAAERVQERGGRFAVCCPNGTVRRLLEVSGAAEGLGLADDRAGGLETLRA
jgi:anti-sigma B factor antagonist